MKRRAVLFPALCLLVSACSLRAADPVYVGASYGLYKSTDAGATWNMLNIPLNSTFLKGSLLPHWLTMDPQNPSKIYMIGEAEGTAFFASADAGATWTIMPFIGMQPGGPGGANLSVDFAGQTIYISASSTTTGGNFALYKSTNTGASWTLIPLPNNQDAPLSQYPFGAPVESFFVDPTVSGTVYGLSNGYHFVKSTDFGSTWTEIVQINDDVQEYGRRRHLHRAQHSEQQCDFGERGSGFDDGLRHRGCGGTRGDRLEINRRRRHLDGASEWFVQRKRRGLGRPSRCIHGIRQ